MSELNENRDEDRHIPEQSEAGYDSDDFEVPDTDSLAQSTEDRSLSLNIEKTSESSALQPLPI